MIRYSVFQKVASIISGINMSKLDKFYNNKDFLNHTPRNSPNSNRCKVKIYRYNCRDSIF